MNNSECWDYVANIMITFISIINYADFNRQSLGLTTSYP